MRKTKWSVRTMALMAIMAAVICVLGPLSVPIGPVPISLTNLAVYLAVYLLGGKRGTISYVVYLLIGMVGVPVFSGFTGGFGKLFGPTGGYLIGFIFMALICGLFIERFHRKLLGSLVGMILGTLVCYAFGTAWLAYQAHLSVSAALAAGVIPFIPFDVGKMIVIGIAAPKICERLSRAGICCEAG